MPSIPKSLENIDLTLQRYRETTYHKRFLLFDTNDSERIISFASDMQLHILSNSKRWHVDGTFKSCPEIFYQVFTIHCWYEEHMYKTVTFLLIGKSTSLYLKALEKLKDSCTKIGIKLDPNFIMSDFEHAILNAFKKAFPEADSKGCYFHFIQSLWKNIKDKHLAKDYKANDENKKWFDKVKSLAFLPPQYVSTGFNLLTSTAPESLKINPNFSIYVNYVYKTWIHGEIWNHFYNNGPRTNNHVEGFHRKIDIELISDHPNLYVFIEYLKKLEVQTYLLFKRRQISNDFNTKRRPEDIFRDQKIVKYKTMLLNDLNSLKTNSYKNELVPILERYISCFSYLYEYKTEDKLDDKQQLSSLITKRLDQYKQNADEILNNFNGLRNFGISLSHDDIKRLNPRCW
ncbi:unnamed protein product [Brachionus calyciflorus]|uniref:MULE transposase domain-containing protein n=1 Tax=Brachionus calyciflorus TaxID=104777 RepID=A0A814QSX9_9BILA|nr:unnamed protein product [Brachionus calyciflorus]